MITPLNEIHKYARVNNLDIQKYGPVQNKEYEISKNLIFK